LRSHCLRENGLPRTCLVVIAGVLLVGRPLSAAPPEFDPSSISGPANRLLKAVDEGERVALRGNVHPLARPEAEIGPVPGDQRLDATVMVLRAGPRRQAALDDLLVKLQDKSSPAYHHWLTPEQFGEAFGASPDDIAAITNWLSSHGLQVDSVPEGRRTVVFSGTAAQVESAFHTTLRRYAVAGDVHFANSTEPEIPMALAPVVEGVVSLHDFRAEAMHMATKPGPEHTTGGYHYLAPADFAAIYDVAPLYTQGIDGTGQTVAIVARSNVGLNDVRSFRASFGLAPRDPAVVLPGRDPGKGSNSDQAEATLDVEWAGAIARNASVVLVPTASTGSSDGAFLSAQYIVNKALAPVLSMSFAACEAALGAAGNSFFHSLWQQAAAEGITVLVSSGDSGAAGCDLPSSSSATLGSAVNGLCSPPDATCVGGTEFDDTASPSLYWMGTDQPSHRSAAGYIPEIAWNESAGTSVVLPSGFSLGSGLAASGGGRSSVYTKPAWQAGAGVPQDGRRDAPDISLTAATHDGYLVQLNGKTQVFSGTSVAVASFAGILALIDQNGGGGSAGNINPKLYSLAGVSSVFHDVSSGNNSVPGAGGYSATDGYDLVTGLGSVDAQALLSAWDAVAPNVPTLTIKTSASNVRLMTASNTVIAVNVAVVSAAGSSIPVRLSVAGLPPGVVARYSPGGVTAPGTSLLTLAAARRTPPGTYTVQAIATPSDGSLPTGISFTLRVLQSSGYRPGGSAQGK
jgi:pseudomonalisin